MTISREMSVSLTGRWRCRRVTRVTRWQDPTVDVVGDTPRRLEEERSDVELPGVGVQGQVKYVPCSSRTHVGGKTPFI